MQTEAGSPQPVRGTVHGVRFEGHVVMTTNLQSWDPDDHKLQPVFEGSITFTCDVCQRERCIHTMNGRHDLPMLLNDKVHCKACTPLQFVDPENIIDYFIN